jgi:hypothetical protein
LEGLRAPEALDGSADKEASGRRALHQARRERQRWAVIGIGVMAAMLALAIVAVSIGGAR